MNKIVFQLRFNSVCGGFSYAHGNKQNNFFNHDLIMRAIFF